jgi:two-component system chemotaxis response regulator CheY
MRKKLKKVLEEAGHDVVGQASDGMEAFYFYKKLTPDVVIMDVTMGKMDGISGAKLIRAFDPQSKIVFMSMVSDQKVIDDAKSLGALDYISKDSYNRLLSLL